MYTTLVSTAALVFTLAVSAVSAEFTVSTPQLNQCGSAQITWSDGKGPYNLVVVPAEDPCGDILADLGDHSGASMTWKNINFAAGTKVMLSLEDDNEDEAWSGEITIGASDDASCLAVASSASGSASVASSSTASSDSARTTLVVGAQPTHAVASTAAAATTSLAVAGAVGNSGSDPLSSGALSMRQLSTPVAAFGVIAAALVFAL
ncbi:hypothetical protein PUNSTDRAFT_125835 [Punctularia strigosozonata HHB-11173 SS5]|uniref:uncharacterized protein n=1 Tax=Punctularia strigosozonata (strain HHB-11173) TaxID=741275 RepID=UPI00044186C2|nr:uncharacterized protein PUNSTDRAFT_125835 [Punctularia strigosozonata HHB-11173 SS5]EIN09775.1 hypothetical protein PUNSTDRAFT_125835 [Punctularia strigosozonata HHB-11173 SS5]